MLYYLRYPLILVLGYAVLTILSPYVFDPRAGENLYTIKEWNEDMSKMYFDMGRFSQKRRDFKSAIRAYTTALEKNPYFLECYENLGLCFELCHQFDKAVQTYLKAININISFFKKRLQRINREPLLEEHIQNIETIESHIETIGARTLLLPTIMWSWVKQRPSGNWQDRLTLLLQEAETLIQKTVV